MQSLRDAKIPYSYYKQPGLWRSDEAEHVTYLLRSLARPEDPSALRTALLTCFLRIPPEHLAALDSLPEDLAAVALFRRWCNLAARRRWGELFHSLLAETGVLFDNLADPRYERRLANFRHLFQVLEQSAYGQSLDLIGLIDVLNKGRLELSGDEESNLQPIETERPKVRIMTVHAAKGDEYPVVFVAGGFTKAPAPNWFTYRATSPEGNLFINLDKNDKQAAACHDAEALSQEQRLMYVALTRAMFKLYLPRLRNESYPGNWAGPLCKIVAAALDSTRLDTMGHPFVQQASSRDFPSPPGERGQG